jgi:hypothetical protein
MQDDPSAQARRVRISSRPSKDDVLVIKQDLQPGRAVNLSSTQSTAR